MNDTELIPHLFRTEYSKIIAVLAKQFGIAYIEAAEDIVSDTFLLAAETWGLKGLPQNPTAWLYRVAKNKAVDFLRRNILFGKKIATQIKSEELATIEPEIDLSSENIRDSQLKMMFAICHPSIPADAQIGLSLNILCGFGVEEIAEALLSSREAMYKKLFRAKEKLRKEKVPIELPPQSAISERLNTVLTTLYLLFSEGYYSTVQAVPLRRELCLEAMRLTLILIDHEQTNTPSANGLLSLMCFHASRFEARLNAQGEIVLYEDQDESLWNQELIAKGQYYLAQASQGKQLTRYHLEAAIAYWHTHKEDKPEKWENILQLYNRLLQLQYSPIAALNRTYALSKANSKEEAIREAEKLALEDNHLYHSLLANLYTGINKDKSLKHLQSAYALAKSNADKKLLAEQISRVRAMQ